MDFHLKQWRDQQQQQQGASEPPEPKQQQQQSSASSAPVNAAKIPRLHLEVESSPYPQSSSFPSSTAPAGPATATLPLFVPEGGGERQQQQRQQEQGEQEAAHPFTKFTSLTSASFPSSDHHSDPCRFPRNSSDSNNYNNMGSYFSWAQWQELELQALIYRYMMAGATVPPELLQPIKKSLLLHSSPYLLHSHFPATQYPPSAALLHSGYWGRAAMDPEPGRCRRTDGKKWRCSRDVVAGQKYCERHMHRGRNRSRKPVEIPTAVSAAAVAATGTTPGGIFRTASSITAADATTVSAVANGGGSHFSLAGSSPSSSIDLFHLDQSYSSEVKAESKERLFGGPNQADNRTDGHILRHFFDDWPRSLQESDNAGGAAKSSTGLSISDVSLKLSTGNVDEPSRNSDHDQPPMSTSWAAVWGPNQVASMGGPLAEALRSSSTTAHSSPTSVLQHLPRASATEVSFISN